MYSGVAIKNVTVDAFIIPTDAPESDGTAEWDSTTLVVAHAQAGSWTGIGYSYADAASARLIRDRLAQVVMGLDALATLQAWGAMVRSVRNLGRAGIASMAIAALDNALWDLKGRILKSPLVSVLGAARKSIPVYGSGGFTSYSVSQLTRQLGDWVECGIRRVKMKVGRDAEADVERVRAARDAVGPEVELFVDANGAYSPKQALAQARRFAEWDVTWFEEPVSSDDLAGLHLLRERGPVGMDIAAGEYGYDAFYFRRMLTADAVDVLQADATRCAGITGFLQAAALCEAFGVPLSAHTAPTLHAHPCCALRARHVEYFHDHARIEHMLFDGALTPVQGELCPDLARPGIGIELKRADAARYAIAI